MLNGKSSGPKEETKKCQLDSTLLEVLKDSPNLEVTETAPQKKKQDKTVVPTPPACPPQLRNEKVTLPFFVSTARAGYGSRWQTYKGFHYKNITNKIRIGEIL
jgi:hypothetical protein